MRSSARHAEEAGSGLDGSAYELLGESLLDASDDEAHTESITSTDSPTLDDAGSDFSDDDNDYPLVQDGLQDSLYSSQADNTAHHMDVLSVGSGEDSTLTERAAGLDRSGSIWIRLDEQPTDDASLTYGSQVFISKPDANSELHKVLEVYGCAQIRMLVKAALASQYVSTPDTYRILYVGKPEKWIEDLITEHIGKALTASPHPSKSVMVRGQIEPFSPVMHRLRCVEIHTFAAHEKPSHALVILEDGQELNFGKGLRSKSNDRPDLVVFCQPAAMGSTEAQDFAAASRILQNEGIACIDLTTARPYGSGVTTFDPHKLRVHVEGCNEGDSDFRLKEILPLDYYTFVHLEPAQLNRHLAFISPHLLAATQSRSASQHLAQGNKKFAESPKAFSSLWPILRTVLRHILVYVLLPGLCLGFFHGLFLYHMSSGAAEVSFSPQNSSLSSTISQAISTSSSVPVAAAPTVKPLPNELTAIPSPPKSAATKPKKQKKDYSFQILGTNDHQFILAPRGAFKTSKNKPQLQIDVSRESEAVAVRYNRTLEGDYIVDLESEYPKSNFTVKIATYSKPLMRQSFEITLGHNRSALEQVLGKARKNLKQLSSLAQEEVQSQVARLEAVKEPVAAYIQETQHEVQRQISTAAELLKHAQGSAWTGLRQATAPVRTSSTVLKARENALRLRCKVETATSLMVKGSSNEESWACAKVREMA
ncbi:hypothetical protein NX059_001225 [Plenodomus lindquistii]|nr:hypothetical protein NX059_001225 [Plenodomus lindquistii]